MKNKEIIEKLSKLDPELDVFLPDDGEYYLDHFLPVANIRQITVGKFKVKTRFSEENEKMGIEPSYEEIYMECNEYNKDSDCMIPGYPIKAIVLEEDDS